MTIQISGITPDSQYNRGTMVFSSPGGGNDRVGQIIARSYRLEARLGAGGFGEVWSATQLSTGSSAAVKLLHPELITDPELVARFKREGLVEARLTHPSAIKVFDTGEAEDGTLWIAMEYLVGRTLATKIEAGPIPAEQVVAILEPVCEVLAEAHSLGIFHRDLKPENIMLVSAVSGREIPKVLDFGLATLVGATDARLTKIGAVSGTPPYMSPEQWDGLRHATAPADIYALGVITYEMLTGRLPFAAESMSGWVRAHALDTPIPFSRHLPSATIPASLEGAVLAALEKEASARPPTTMDFWRGLKAAIGSTAGHRDPGAGLGLAATAPAWGDSGAATAPTADSAPRGATSDSPVVVARAPTRAASRRWLQGLMLAGAAAAVGGLATLAVVFTSSTSRHDEELALEDENLEVAPQADPDEPPRPVTAAGDGTGEPRSSAAASSDGDTARADAPVTAGRKTKGKRPGAKRKTTTSTAASARAAEPTRPSALSAISEPSKGGKTRASSGSRRAAAAPENLLEADSWWAGKIRPGGAGRAILVKIKLLVKPDERFREHAGLLYMGHTYRGDHSGIPEGEESCWTAYKVRLVGELTARRAKFHTEWRSYDLFSRCSGASLMKTPVPIGAAGSCTLRTGKLVCSGKAFSGTLVPTKKLERVWHAAPWDVVTF